MNRLSILVVIAVLIHSGCVFGQTFPKLTIINTNAEVSYDLSAQMYTYVYRLKNDHGNTGSIESFHIDISRDSNSIMYDTVGLRFSNALYATWFQRDYAELASRVVPVGFPALPSSYWMALLSPHFLTAGFYKDTLFVLPGDSISLVLMSRALPGIRNFAVECAFDPYALFPEVPDSVEPPYSMAEIDSIEESCNYHGTTVGPVAPRSPLDSLAFLDTLRSYSARAFSLGWISNQAIADKYKTLFDSVKTQLSRGNAQKARATLDAIMVRARGDAGSALTSEAFALIYFNAKYLSDISRKSSSK